MSIRTLQRGRGNVVWMIPVSSSPPDSEAVGHEIVNTAVSQARRLLGPDLLAAFTLGSLAHGGFAPLVSDVDLALIVVDPAIANQVEAIKELVHERFDSPLTRRLSVFWATWEQVHRGARPPARLPDLDRLDLLDSGVIEYGEDRRRDAERPTTDALIVQGAEFALAKFDDAFRTQLTSPEQLVTDGPRAATKAALFPVRFLYTLHSGRIGRNDDAAAWYQGPCTALVNEAMRWRSTGIDDRTSATAVLRTQLVPIYREFVSDYSSRLHEMGRGDLAANLESWAQKLD